MKDSIWQASGYPPDQHAGYPAPLGQTEKPVRLNDTDNDIWLIYAHDEYRDEYLLLTIVGPDAHNRKEWGSYLRTIHNQIVEPWLVGKLVYPDIDE